jgi:UDP-GlcNAc3NAcA epimerase
MKMPEEVNRILTDRISTILFCPTRTAIDNLQREGVDSWNVDVQLSGDVMQDGAIFYKDLSVKPDNIDSNTRFILSTIHRAENTDDLKRLCDIVEALNAIAEEKTVILPLHPRTKSKLAELPISLNGSVKIIDPVGYLNMVWLIDNCDLVMTDSGGLQKEAYFFAKPCITLRDETEWVELVDNDFNVLTGADKSKIIKAYKQHVFANNYELDLYGAGEASKRIVSYLSSYE